MIRDFIRRIVKPLFRYFGLEISGMEFKSQPPPAYNDLEKAGSIPIPLH